MHPLLCWLKLIAKMNPTMRDRKHIVSLLTDPGIIAVVRAKTAAQVLPIAEALLTGGVVAIEITMTTPNAIEAIRQARETIGDRALVGVGTVLDAPTCRDALDAGAEFVVTPICRTELVSIAHAAGCPIMIVPTHPLKLSSLTKPARISSKSSPPTRSVPATSGRCAPLPHLRLVPTGGVDVDNVADFLQAGCAALGVGSALVSSRMLETSDWPALTQRAAEFVAAARNGRMK